MPFLALLTRQSPISDFGWFQLEALEMNTVPAATQLLLMTKSFGRGESTSMCLVC